jgi:hypothetical protein
MRSQATVDPLGSFTKSLQIEKGVGSIPLKFTRVTRFTTFFVEYAIKDGDIVVHFFPSEEAHKSQNARTYWFDTFPLVLDKVACASFGVQAPRLEAGFVEVGTPSPTLPGMEPVWFDAYKGAAMPSWWLVAHGFMHVIDPDALVDRFFSALDSALDAANAM